MIKLTKNKQELLNYLGKEYNAKNIDMEPCIYRDFGDYDIELSEPLAEGEYLGYLKIQVFKPDGTELNGAKVEFNLTVVKEK